MSPAAPDYVAPHGLLAGKKVLVTAAAGTVKERRTWSDPALVSSASAAAGPETWNRRR